MVFSVLIQASKEILYFDLRSANGQRVSREVEIEAPKPTPSAPGAERNRANEQNREQRTKNKDEQNKEKQEGAEHTKGETKSQGKRENSEIKEKRSENLEGNTEREDGNPEIEDDNSKQKDAHLKEKLEYDGEAKASVKKDIAENLHDKDDQNIPLQQDENKAWIIPQIDEIDSQSEITNVRPERDVLISREIQLRWTGIQGR